MIRATAILSTLAFAAVAGAQQPKHPAKADSAKKPAAAAAATAAAAAAPKADSAKHAMPSMKHDSTKKAPKGKKPGA